MKDIFYSLICVLLACVSLIAEEPRILDVSGQIFETEEQLQEVLDYYSVETLILKNTRIDCLGYLCENGKFPVLKKLVLDGLHVVDSPGNPYVIYSGYPFFNMLIDFAPELEELSMNDLQEPPISLVGLRNFPNLKVLKLNQMHYLRGSRKDYEGDGRLYCSHVNLPALYNPIGWYFESNEWKALCLPSLEHLEVDGLICHDLSYGIRTKTKKLYFFVSKFAPNLKFLSAKNIDLEHSDWSEISKLVHLETLDLSIPHNFYVVGEIDIGRYSFPGMLSSLTALRSLSLAGSEINDSLPCFPALEYLDLSRCKLSESCFDSLFALQNLKRLDLRDVKGVIVSHERILMLERALPSCEVLYSGKECADDLCNCPRSLDYSEQTSLGLQDVINRPFLEELNLSRLVWFGETMQSFFSSGYFPHLTKLVFDEPLLSKDSKFLFPDSASTMHPFVYPFEKLGAFSENLKSLSLKSANLSVSDLRGMETLNYLESLNLSKCIFSKENIEQLQYMQIASLEELYVENSNIKGAPFNEFAPNLKRLFLKESNITGGDIAKIALLKNLESLDISNTSITGASIKKLGVLKNLKELSMEGNNLETADFSTLPVSLEYLNLASTQISLKSFSTLSSLVNLKVLDISNLENMNIRSAEIESLQQALPSCKILSVQK